ncbi:hypothetical protein [Nocardia terpenica]|uniref:Uncharacterized protein n=1 Tax=Nocardia terpenica TaxID=455432 RepID=A0A291RDB6_9NOCA|nr:hypothetical protein [Nocardia terpenica]ATL65591.1 hypothetical protein CRH09_04570 [Nocardia terpenica]
MIPQLVTVRVTRPDRRPLRIWVPVLPVVLVFAPVLVLAVLGVAVACLVYRLSVMRVLGAGLRFAAALPGTRVHIEEGQTAFLISIR